METAQELAAGHDAEKNANQKRGWLKIPITVLLLAQLAVTLCAVAVPLGYIALNSASDITQSLTAQLIESKVSQAIAGVNSVLNQAVVNNFSLAMVHHYKQNPYIYIYILMLGNAVAYQTGQNEMLGMINVPCASFNVVGLGDMCYMRTIESVAQGPYLWAALVNPYNGSDIIPPFQFLSRPFQIMPSNMRQLADSPQNQSRFHVEATMNSVENTFSIFYDTAYLENPNDVNTFRFSSLGMNCLKSVKDLFTTVLPSPNSNMFLIDENGLMVASTINGSVGMFPNNSLVTGAYVRFTSYKDNPDATTQLVGEFLAGAYGLAYPSANTSAFAITQNFTLSTVNIAGTTMIISTKLLPMPSTNQVYLLVCFGPRSDFFGESDSAIHNSLTAALVIAAVGIAFVGVLAYLGSIPLKKLASAMEKAHLPHPPNVNTNASF
ncbi:hypothetical protein HDU82_002455 [Entophlyctis luteolus]|nr:hypothetical protein HDU82_002455 [Entophlyctis luteolus]